MIRVVHPGSESCFFTHPGWIPDPEVKQTSDPNPQHYSEDSLMIQERAVRAGRRRRRIASRGSRPGPSRSPFSSFIFLRDIERSHGLNGVANFI
jgi:hypothetical protein